MVIFGSRLRELFRTLLYLLAVLIGAVAGVLVAAHRAHAGISDVSGVLLGVLLMWCLCAGAVTIASWAARWSGDWSGDGEQEFILVDDNGL